MPVVKEAVVPKLFLLLPARLPVELIFHPAVRLHPALKMVDLTVARRPVIVYPVVVAIPSLKIVTRQHPLHPGTGHRP